MREDVTDINFASVEMDRSDKPILVAGDIEYDPVAHLVGRGKSGANLGKASEIRVTHHFEPATQRCLAVRMPFPEEP